MDGGAAVGRGTAGDDLPEADAAGPRPRQGSPGQEQEGWQTALLLPGCHLEVVLLCVLAGDPQSCAECS